MRCTQTACMHFPEYGEIDVRIFSLQNFRNAVTDFTLCFAFEYFSSACVPNCGHFKERLWFYLHKKMVKIKLIPRTKTSRQRTLHHSIFFAWCLQAKANFRRLFIFVRLFNAFYPLISCHANRPSVLKPSCVWQVRVFRAGEKNSNNFTTNVIVFIWINSWRNTNQICFCHTKCCNFGLRLYLLQQCVYSVI